MNFSRFSLTCLAAFLMIAVPAGKSETKIEEYNATTADSPIALLPGDPAIWCDIGNALPQDPKFCEDFEIALVLEFRKHPHEQWAVSLINVKHEPVLKFRAASDSSFVSSYLPLDKLLRRRIDAGHQVALDAFAVMNQ